MSALAWRGATVRAGGRSLLDGVDLTVERGARVVIVGANGAGKTTLLRAALGLVGLAAGEVLLEGRPTGAWSARERAGALAWLPQARRGEEAVTALERVASARYRLDEPRPVALRAAADALARVGAGALADRAVDRLSGGEAQRVALATLVAQDARTWLLDEPANHLDPAVQRGATEALAALAGPDRTLVVVSHDLGLLPSLAPPGAPEALDVVGLAEGRVAFRLGAADPHLPDALGALLGVRVRRVHLDGADQLVVTGVRA